MTHNAAYWQLTNLADIAYFDGVLLAAYKKAGQTPPPRARLWNPIRRLLIRSVQPHIDIRQAISTAATRVEDAKEAIKKNKKRLDLDIAVAIGSQAQRRPNNATAVYINPYTIGLRLVNQYEEAVIRIMSNRELSSFDKLAHLRRETRQIREYILLIADRLKGGTRS